MNVLVSLHKGYGLGDCVMVSAVLRHLAKYRPDWRVDYQAGEGRHQVGRGIVANTFAYEELYPTSHYDAEVQICLYDAWKGYSDRPNTHLSACLKDTFDIDWCAECGRYQVAVLDRVRQIAKGIVLSDSKCRKTNGKVVAIHYQGDSAALNKDLSHDQAAAICKAVEALGGTPLIIDWRGTSPLRNVLDVRSTWRIPEQYGGDAEMNCALIGECAAFVGIDSGPAKCASATDTPALVVWTKHHPARFHDPSENTTHLVPRGYHDLLPLANRADAVEWFEGHYRTIQYDNSPVRSVIGWLTGVFSVVNRCQND